MIKKLLSFAAVAALSLGVTSNAETLDMLPSLSNDAYDAATKTITFEKEWGWVNWWFGDKDYSEYDEFVLEFEPVEYTVQIAIEYNNDVESAAFQAQAGESKVVATLDPAGKKSMKQLAIQNSKPGKLVLKAAYFQNAVEVDPNEPVVLFEGSQDMADNWYPGLEIPKAKVIAGGAGATLEIQYTATGEGVSYKLCGNWTNDVLPSFKNVEGFNSEYSSVYTSANPITYTLTAEDIAFLQGDGDSNFHISGGGEGFVITKVLLKPAATVGIDTIAVDENAPVEYYNLQGVRVANPESGIYVVRQGNKVSKVLVK